MAFFPQGLNVTPHLTLELRLRMNGAIPPLLYMLSWHEQRKIYLELFLFYFSGNWRDKIKNEFGNKKGTALCVK
jgi:hypothetical protein